MYRCLDLPTIDSEEVLKKLKETAVDIIHEVRPAKKGQSFLIFQSRVLDELPFVVGVRFSDDPPNPTESLPLPETSASMIYMGYLSVNSVVRRVLSVETDPSTDDDIFALTRSYLTQIFPLLFRLELLENIFSLVFIQQSELKAEETVDIVEPSAYTRSMSLSNSDRFLSSAQSNVTNDSLQASTNASVKTQMSLPRLDGEAEEDQEDNVSVCSSSMSSAGVTHPSSIYRSGLLIDPQVFYQLLVLLNEQLAEARSLHQKIYGKAIDRPTVDFETSLDKYFWDASINSEEQFASRSGKLSSILSETLWRHRLLTGTTVDSSSQENRVDGQESTDSLINNPAIKSLILPLRKCLTHIF